MKNILALLFLFVSLSQVLAQQDDDTVEFVQGLPETGEEADIPPVSPDELSGDNKVAITKAQIPPAVKEALKDTATFGSNDDQQVFFDRKIKLYRVEVDRKNTRRFFTLDEGGKIISVQEKNINVRP